MLVLNKPMGLAVQGGSGTKRHVDGLLEALRDGEGQKPRLVHRLDKDTSGCLVVAKTRFAAVALAKSFRSRLARKIYWALVAGVPRVKQGRVSTYLAKEEVGERDARMRVASHGDEGASHALTYYAVIETAAQRLAWLSFKPVTGRTHQLRAHAAHIGHPIVGDPKYFDIENWELPGGIQKRLHLLARRIVIPHPRTGKPIDVTRAAAAAHGAELQPARLRRDALRPDRRGAGLAVKLVVFDVDGTLVDSQHLIVEAQREAFAAHGLRPPSRARSLSVVGLSLPEAFTALVGAHGPVEGLAAAYRDAFGRLRADPAWHEPLFPGAAELVADLAGQDGVALGIATGKSRRGVAHLVARHRWDRIFATIQTADDAPSKPDPAMLRQAMAEAGAAPGDTVMIGDSTFDMLMARAAGVRPVGVSWGYHPVAALTEAGAESVVGSYGQLRALLLRIRMSPGSSSPTADPISS